MSEVPNIDLTAAVDAAARELFVTTYALQHAQEDRDEVVDSLRQVWDEGLGATSKLYHRRIALAALEVAVPYIARQAWEVAIERADAAADDCCGCNLWNHGDLETPWPDPELEGL